MSTIDYTVTSGEFSFTPYDEGVSFIAYGPGYVSLFGSAGFPPDGAPNPLYQNLYSVGSTVSIDAAGYSSNPDGSAGLTIDGVATPAGLPDEISSDIFIAGGPFTITGPGTFTAPFSVDANIDCMPPLAPCSYEITGQGVMTATVGAPVYSPIPSSDYLPGALQVTEASFQFLAPGQLSEPSALVLLFTALIAGAITVHRNTWIAAWTASLRHICLIGFEIRVAHIFRREPPARI